MKCIKITIDDKEYTLGFENRASIKRAERLGLNILGGKEVLNFSDKLFYTSLLDRQPEMTEAESDEIIGKLAENGYDYIEIVQALRVLIEEVFSSTQIKDPKKKKAIKIENS